MPGSKKGSKGLKEHLTLKSKKSILILFTILNILILGFILGALSGDTKNLSENEKIGLIIPLIIIPLLILLTIQSQATWAKIITAILIFSFVLIGIVEVSLTQPDVNIKAQILGFLAFICVGIHWIFIHFKMCDLCGT